MNRYQKFNASPIYQNFFVLEYQYPGVLGAKDRPGFPAISFVYQSLNAIVHFHHCLN